MRVEKKGKGCVREVGERERWGEWRVTGVEETISSAPVSLFQREPRSHCKRKTERTFNLIPQYVLDLKKKTRRINCYV